MTETAESSAYVREDGLWVIPRHEFAFERFAYKAGEHVVFGGPTQRGKTTLAFQLLDAVATPELPAYVAVSKPHDNVSEAEGKRMGFRRVTDWPVPRQMNEYWDGKPRGYLVWPKFGDMYTDVDKCSEVTARLLADRYTAGVRKKHAILVMDDTMVKSKIMGLDREMVTVFAMAGAMGIGEWVFVQKPTGSGNTAIWGYSSAEHLFILRDTDKRNRLRYDEIGGFDPRVVSQASLDLKPFQFLYLKRTEGYMCVVDSK
jgi:hypothetical protein